MTVVSGIDLAIPTPDHTLAVQRLSRGAPVVGAIRGLCMSCPPDAKVAILRRLFAKASKRSRDVE